LILRRYVLEIGAHEGEPAGWIPIPSVGDPEVTVGNPVPRESPTRR
jgi:hypothetical protein